LFAVFAAGCAEETVVPGSAAPEVSQGNDTTAVAPKQLRTMPLPQGNWTKKTNIEHYKMFATHADALGWFEGIAKRYQLDGKPLPTTDPNYDPLEKELEVIWKSFTELFPRDTEGLTKPPFIVLTDSQDVNAFAIYDPELAISPHVFIVNVGIFTSKNGRANTTQIRGLIAHELAHHVLKHQWPDNREKVQKWYSVDKAAADGFGWQQKDDPTLRKTGVAFVTATTDTGDSPLVEWNGVPRLGGILSKTLTYVHRDARAREPEKCSASELAYEALEIYLKSVTDTLQTLSLTAAVKKRIDELTRAYVEKELACGGSSTDTLWKSLAEQYQTTEAAFKAQLAKTTTATIIDNARSPTDAVFSLVKRYDQSTVSLGDVSKLRYYSTEEEADDVSINVLFRAGYDANGTASLLEDIGRDDAWAKACKAASDAGEPSYGPLSDDHHHACWRIWHSKQLIKYLSTPE
jgi:hypothetical protein